LGAREEILDKVRKKPPPSRPAPTIPLFHLGGRSLRAAFEDALNYMAGEVVAQPPADFGAFLRERFPGAKNICSAVPEYRGNFKPRDLASWADAAAIDLAIVRSPLGVAETGSVVLTEKELGVNTIGFLAHDIVILLDPQHLVENIHDVYLHDAFRVSKYAVLMTGPSGTGDIGGVTLHPAQGVTTLTVIFWPESCVPTSAGELRAAL
jgi:L-lactate dehydrogenase complex protein LldG